MKNRAGFMVASLFATLAVASAGTAQTVPAPFRARLLAGGLVSPKGLDSAHYQAGAGPMGDYLYVAESGLNRIVEIDLGTGLVEPMAATLGAFPVGVGCYGGPFAQYMYIGCAYGGGIERMDMNGVTTAFALTGLSVAGLDFGKGPFGQYLYAGEWPNGRIWRVDQLGNATLFATVPGEARYLEFSDGGPFGHNLFVSDYMTGTVYRVDPRGAVTLFASTAAFGLEGLSFGPGGAFGTNLFVGSLATGQIFEIAPNGAVSLWGSGFPGVADIRFLPGGRGGFTMALVDGHSAVYTVRKEAIQ